ncbi:FtsX-like permease family protein [Streptomyces sp. 6N223]|uniref:FtsX-like permease family protein n=1 Tax=Streptomyces sp. 6N223 TaxID=3457412 RepID=UPI003FD3AD80
MRGWARDMALGARFAVSGGRSGWARTLLTAVGVGLGVLVLLLAASAPRVLQAQDERVANREPSCFTAVSGCPDLEPGPETVLFRNELTRYHDADIGGASLQPDAGAETTATPPPGLDAFPSPGEMVVSPALGRMLDSDDGELLAQRLDYERVGTIGEEGLEGSGDLFFYLGSASLQEGLGANVERVDSFGGEVVTTEYGAPLMLLIVIICVALLTPIAVFIATAVRFGGERRDRRLAALRLVGADAMTARRIAAGEALVGAVAGLLLGVAALLSTREVLGSITLFGFSTFPSEITPDPSLTALILLAVPATAVAVALFALRGVAIEPMGVVRHGTVRRRRLPWRLLPFAAGLVLLMQLAGSTLSSDDDLGLAQAAVGMVLVLVGLTLLLPWLVDRLVGWMRGGPVSWQLATRRLQLRSGPAARAVSGITVAVAGATALYMLFAGVRADQTTETGRDPSQYQVEVSASVSGEVGLSLAREIDGLPGVTESFAITTGYATRPDRQAAGDGVQPAEVVVGDCAALREMARIETCANGDVFLTRDTVRPGDRLDLNADYDGPLPGESRPWTVPRSARRVAVPETIDIDHTFLQSGAVFATHGALDVGSLGDALLMSAIETDPSDRNAIEQIRNAAWERDPDIYVWEVESETLTDEFSGIQTGLLVGASGVMLLIGASLIVSTLEQLQERRRLLSVLVAFGTRRGTLGASVLWQTAIPVVLGLALAAVVGTCVGAALMATVDISVTGWLAFLPMTAVGVGVIALVTLASMPFLWRLMRPDGLRTE